MLTGQGKNPFPMLPVAREHAAAELAVWVEPQMLSLAVLAAFGASRALGLPSAVAKLTDHLQFRAVQAHCGP